MTKILFDFRIPDENATEPLSAFLLDLIWRIGRETGICPICLVETMHDLMVTAHAEGKIEHTNPPPQEEDQMGEPPVRTVQ